MANLQNFKNLKTNAFYTRKMALLAVLAATSIVLSFFSISLGNSIRLGFGFLPLAVVGILFGPIIGGLFAIILDFITYVLKPTGAFFWGFSLSALLTGVIYGWFFYGKKISIHRIVVAKVLVMIFIHMILNTYWVHLLYGEGFFLLLPARLLKNVILLPIEIFLIWQVARIITSQKLDRFLGEKLGMKRNFL